MSIIGLPFNPINKGLMEQKKKEDKTKANKCLFFLLLPSDKMEGVAQLVRASVCGTEGRGFETHRSPWKKPVRISLMGF